MKLIDATFEVHTMISHGVTCPNRDDNNTPKTAKLGEVTRGRGSSQWKGRNVRLYIRDRAEDKAWRTRDLSVLIAERLQDKDKAENAQFVANFVAAQIVKKKEEKKGKSKKSEVPAEEEVDEGTKSQVALFVSDSEVDAVAAIVSKNWDELLKLAQEDEKAVAAKDAEKAEKAAKAKEAAKAAKDNGEKRPRRDFSPEEKPEKTLPSEIEKQLKACFHTDVQQCLELAMFGRTCMEVPDMEIDKICRISHALTTNPCSVEPDWWVQMDDKAKEASNMGSTEFLHSPTFYHYATLGMRQLIDNLAPGAAKTGKPASEQVKELAIKGAVLFVQALIFARHQAMQNGTANDDMTEYVRVIARTGAPRNFVRAFDLPAHATDSKNTTEVSIEKIGQFEKRVNRMYGNDIIFDVTANMYDDKSLIIADLLAKVNEFLQKAE